MAGVHQPSGLGLRCCRAFPFTRSVGWIPWRKPDAPINAQKRWKHHFPCPPDDKSRQSASELLSCRCVPAVTSLGREPQPGPSESGHCQSLTSENSHSGLKLPTWAPGSTHRGGPSIRTRSLRWPPRHPVRSSGVSHTRVCFPRHRRPRAPTES